MESERVRHDRAQMHHNNKNNGTQVKETAPTWSQNCLLPASTADFHNDEPVVLQHFYISFLSSKIDYILLSNICLVFCTCI